MHHPGPSGIEPLAEDLHIAGMPRVHVEVSTASLGGQLYALLEDCDNQATAST